MEWGRPRRPLSFRLVANSGGGQTTESRWGESDVDAFVE